MNSQTLKTSRVVGQPAYRFYIAPNYLHLFQHLILDSTDTVENSYFLASLHSFTSLREITITRSASDAIFGTTNHLNDLHSDPGIAAFALKASTIRVLHLAEFTATEAIPLLWVFKSLSTLEMGPFDGAPVERVKEFALAIPNLRSLKLNLNEMEATDLPSNTSGDLWPPLESIEIVILQDSDEGGEVPDLDFLKDFRRSLISLAIDSPTIAGGQFSTLTFPDNAHFPQLKSVSVVGRQQTAFAIFDNAQHSTFPSLTTLRLSYNDNYNGSFGADDRILRQVLEFPTLRFLEYSPPDQDIGDDDQSYLTKETSARGIQVRLRNCPADTFPSSLYLILQQNPDIPASVKTHFLDGSTTYLEKDMLECVSSVKEYLDQVVANARRTGDMINLYRVVGYLQKLELDRLALLD